MAVIITTGQLTLRAELYHQLGMMLTAGMTLPKALEQIQKTGPRSFRGPITRLLHHLNEGATLTEAVEQLGHWMPSFDRALVEAGERSGRLDACFKLLSSYYTERAQTAKQVISDMIYPMFIVHVAAVIFPFISAFSTGNWGRFGLTVLAILLPLYGAAFFIVYACQGRHGEKWRAGLEKTLRVVPVLGAARKNLALGRLAAALEALISAGVNIIGAWDLAAAASGSPALRRIVSTWKIPLENGVTPAELVSQSREFPELFASLYHTGETSGQLDQTLRRLHNMHQEEGSRKMHAFASWTPKLIYFAILILVGWKIVSSYSNMWAEADKLSNF